jgi:hypothetical protein
MKQRRGAYRILAGKFEGRRPLGRPRHRWEYYIKMGLREVAWRGMDWIDLNKWQAVVNMVMNLWVP